jgi:2-aminoadipate transaminase
MRLNFSAQTEDEIVEGIRRIGDVVGEQVGLYETMTGSFEIVQPEDRPSASAASRPGADAARTTEDPPAGEVLPFQRRPPEKR